MVKRSVTLHRLKESKRGRARDSSCTRMHLFTQARRRPRASYKCSITHAPPLPRSSIPGGRRLSLVMAGTLPQSQGPVEPVRAMKETLRTLNHQSPPYVKEKKHSISIPLALYFAGQP